MSSRNPEEQGDLLRQVFNCRGFDKQGRRSQSIFLLSIMRAAQLRKF